MSDKETTDSELDRLQRDLLVFLTHRIAEMGVGGQSPAVELNKAIVEAIVRQNREAAQAAAGEVERQARAGMADLASRLDRIEQGLAAARMEPAPGAFAEPRKPGAHRSGARALANRAERDQGNASFPDEADLSEASRPDDAEPLGDGDAQEDEDGFVASDPGKGWMAHARLAMLAAALLLPAGVLGLGWYSTWQDKVAAVVRQKAMTEDKLGFCELAGEAIRALDKPADAPVATTVTPAPTASAASGSATAQSPEQQRLATAAAQLCRKDD